MMDFGGILFYTTADCPARCNLVAIFERLKRHSRTVASLFKSLLPVAGQRPMRDTFNGELSHLVNVLQHVIAALKLTCVEVIVASRSLRTEDLR